LGTTAVIDVATSLSQQAVKMRNAMGEYASQNIRSFAIKMIFDNRLMVEGSTIELFMR
jgi:hypothetical protein